VDLLGSEKASKIHERKIADKLTEIHQKTKRCKKEDFKPLVETFLK